MMYLYDYDISIVFFNSLKNGSSCRCPHTTMKGMKKHGIARNIAAGGHSHCSSSNPLAGQPCFETAAERAAGRAAENG